MSSSEQDKVFDRRLFLSGMMDDVALSRQIAELSLIDLRKHLSAMDAVFASGDREELMRNAHSIKGVSAHVRCGRLYEKAKAIEQTAKHGILEDARVQCSDFKVLVLEAIDALEGYLESLKEN